MAVLITGSLRDTGIFWSGLQIWIDTPGHFMEASWLAVLMLKHIPLPIWNIPPTFSHLRMDEMIAAANAHGLTELHPGEESSG